MMSRNAPDETRCPPAILRRGKAEPGAGALVIRSVARCRPVPADQTEHQRSTVKGARPRGPGILAGLWATRHDPRACRKGSSRIGKWRTTTGHGRGATLTLLATVYSFCLALLSVMPSPPAVLPDSYAHALAAGVQAALFYGVAVSFFSPLGSLAAAWIGAVTFSGLGELLQAFVPPRAPEVRDLVAGALGASVALYAIVVARRPFARLWRSRSGRALHDQEQVLGGLCGVIEVQEPLTRPGEAAAPSATARTAVPGRTA